MRSVTPPKACACSNGGARTSRRCTQANALSTPYSSRCKVRRSSINCPSRRLRIWSTPLCRIKPSLRYRDFDHLFDYCRYSANPVGRLVLGLCGYSDEERYALSDATCTALQLANFWQDVTVDLKKDRVYLPLGLLEAHGYPVEALWEHRFDDRFQAAMREAVEVARKLFIQGLPLADRVDRAPVHRPRTLQPGRPARPRQDRAARLRRANVATIRLKARARRLAHRSTTTPSLFQSRMNVEQSYAHCESVARAQAKNFYVTFLLLGRDQRRAMCAIYAFMRYCDDLSDDAGIADRASAIAAWNEDSKRPWRASLR